MNLCLFYLRKIKTGKQWLVFPMELSVWCRIKAPGINGRCKSLHVVHIPSSHLFRWARGSIDVGTNQARSVETQWSYSCSLGFLLHSFFLLVLISNWNLLLKWWTVPYGFYLSKCLYGYLWTKNVIWNNNWDNNICALGNKISLFPSRQEKQLNWKSRITAFLKRK